VFLKKIMQTILNEMKSISKDWICWLPSWRSFKVQNQLKFIKTFKRAFQLH